MPEKYNPIVRSFNRYRAALLAITSAPRSAIRPDTRLDTLISPDRHPELWRTFVAPRFVNTVGELAVSGVRFNEHGASGYRWSRGDIELKTRLIFAEFFDLPLEEIRPETRPEEIA